MVVVVVVLVVVVVVIVVVVVVFVVVATTTFVIVSWDVFEGPKGGDPKTKPTFHANDQNPHLPHIKLHLVPI